MKSIAILASGAISPLGNGDAAFSVGSIGERLACRVRRDQALADAGLAKPFVARVPLAAHDGDRAYALLERALLGLATNLDHVQPDWRGQRVGVVLGTSCGGMASLERALALRAGGGELPSELARSASYFAPLRALHALAVVPCRELLVLGACASSTIAIGLGCRWLQSDRCDLVIAGGFDALTPLVAAGFESLGATTAGAPRPFLRERDGLALGEGAAVLALARADERPALGYVSGFGLSSDAIHVTAPDRAGTGLARAAQRAVADAGIEASSIDLVSAHGTATPYNDASEARAIQTTLGQSAARAYVHAFKSVVGHTLGAAGALELLAALDAARREILPGHAAEGELEPELTACLLRENAPGKISHVLKLATAFGGANAALVASPRRPRRSVATVARRRVRAHAVGEVCVAADPAAIARFARLSALDIERLDELSGLTLTAIASALQASAAPPADTTGVLVGTTSATIEADEAFAQRLRARGPRGVEPRRFPATSPNLAAGRATIAFGYKGPSFSVGSGPLAAIEALLTGVELLESGDADSLVVVAAEAVGEVVRRLWQSAGAACPEAGALAVVLDCGPTGTPLDSDMLLDRLRSAVSEPDGAPPGWPLLKRTLLAGIG